MAQLGSYAQALGQMASDAAIGGLKGLGRGAKMAAMSEMPALTLGMAFAKDVRDRASKIQDAKLVAAEERQVKATEKLVDQQAKNNVISLDMARQIRQMNQSIKSQTSLLNVQVQDQKRQQQFAEESEREAKNQQEKLLKALEKMAGASGAGAGSSGTDAGKDGSSEGGFIDSILGWLGNAVLAYLGIKKGSDLIRKGIGAAAGRMFGPRLSASSLGGRFGFGGRMTAGRTPTGGAGGRIPPTGGGFWSRLGSRAGSKLGLGALAKRGASVFGGPVGGAIGAGLLAYDIYDVLSYAFGGGDQGGGGQGGFSPFGPIGLAYAAYLAKKNRKENPATKMRYQAYTPRPPAVININDPLSSAAGTPAGSTTRASDKSSLNVLSQVPSTGVSPRPSTSTESPARPSFLPSSVSSNIQDLIIQAESGGRNIGNLEGASSAFGIAQITKPTFEGLVAQAKPGDSLYQKTFAEMQKSIPLQRAALSKLTESNIKGLRSKNIAIDDVAVYLAHFLGQEGAIKVLSASNDTPIKNVVSERSINANKKVFANIKTVADLKAWAQKQLDEAKKKVGTTSQSGAVATAISTTAPSTTPGVTVEQQTKIVQAMGKAWVSAYSNPNLTEDQKKVVLNEYEKQAAKLKSMTGDSRSSVTVSSTTGVAATPVAVASTATEDKGDASPSSAKLNRGKKPEINVTHSGTEITQKSEPVPVYDAKANKTLEKIQESQRVVEKESKGLSTSSALAARMYQRYKVSTTRRILTPEEEADEYLKKAQQGFLNSLDRTFTKAFKDFGTNFLKSVGYTPGGTTVGAQEGGRVGYAGQQIGKMLDIDKKTSKALEKFIGKEYGRMLSPAVSQLGKAYLNSFAVSMGQNLFAGTTDSYGNKISAQEANALTGMILGNFAKGNKQVAMEQLLYGLTGVASGPETIAQSYGFRNAAEGINYMAEVFAAKSTNFVQGLFGWEDRTKGQQVRDPATGKMYTPGEGLTGGVAMPDRDKVGYGGLKLPQQPTTTFVGKQDNLLVSGARTLNGVLLVSVTNAGDLATDEEKLKHSLQQGLMGFTTRGMGQLMGMRQGQGSKPFDFNQTAAKSSPYDLAVAAPDLSQTGGNRWGLLGSEPVTALNTTAEWTQANYDLTSAGQRISLNAMNASTETNRSVTSQADQNNQMAMENQTQRFEAAISRIPASTGSGTTIGLGSFTGDFTNFLGNMALSFVANKLTSGIKNPYVKAIANFGINYAGQKVILPQILGTAGAGAAGAGAAGGASLLTALGIGSTATPGSMSLFSAMGAAGGFSGFGDALKGSLGLGGTGMTLSGFAANTAANMGFTGASNFFAGMNATSSAGLTAAGTAGYYAGQALPYAGAIMQALQGDFKSAAISGAATYLLMLNPVTAPFAFLGSIVGGLFGKGGKKEPPPKIFDKVLVIADKDITKKITVREENAPPEAAKSFVDALLNTAFNTAMSIYVATKANPPFNAIYISIRNNVLRMALPSNYTGGIIDGDWAYEATMGEKDPAQKFMLEIMRKIKEVYTAQSQDPAYLTKIEEGYNLVKSKSSSELASGLITPLQYGKYALDEKNRFQLGESGTTSRPADVIKLSDVIKSSSAELSSLSTASVPTTSVAGKKTFNIATKTMTPEDAWYLKMAEQRGEDIQGELMFYKNADEYEKLYAEYLNGLIAKNKAEEAADPAGYAARTAVNNILHDGKNISERLQAYQRDNNLSDEAMLAAIASQRPGIEPEKNLNLLKGPPVTTAAPPITITTKTTETSPGSLTPIASSGTSVTITPTSGVSGGGGGSGGNQNINVVTDNSKTTNEGSVVNTTYLNTNTGGDLYGRAGLNTSLAVPV